MTTVTIDNLPDVSDINAHPGGDRVHLGAKVDRIDRHTVKINGCKYPRRDRGQMNISERSVRPIILSARFLENIKSAEVPLPGGCDDRKPSDRPAFKGFPCPGMQM